MPAPTRILKPQLSDLYDRSIKYAWMQGLGQTESQYEPFFISETTQRQDEASTYVSGLGMWPQSPQLGAPLTYDGIYQGFDTRITPYTYKLGVQIEEETVEDDLTGILGGKIAASLAETGRYTVEYLAASVFNRAFADTAASPWMSGGDGTTLFSTAHPILAGGVYPNRPSAGTDLSVTSLQLCINRLKKMQSAAGLLTPYPAKMLVVPTELERTAREILESDKLPYSGDNTTNVLRNRLELYVWDYLTDSNAFFVGSGKATLGGTGFTTVCLWRVKPEFDRDNHFQTGDRLYKGRFRVGFGYWDWRGWDGSPGAT